MPVQRIRFTQATDEFPEINWNKRGLNSLLKKILKTERTVRRHGCGRMKNACTEEIVTTDCC